MWPDRVSNPGPLTYESDALPTGLRGPANLKGKNLFALKMVEGGIDTSMHGLSFLEVYPCPLHRMSICSEGCHNNDTVIF